jgi:hypothetical protein
VEKGADVPGAVEDRTRQPDLLGVAHGVFPFCRRQPLWAGHPPGRSTTCNGSGPHSGKITPSTTESKQGRMICANRASYE